MDLNLENWTVERMLRLIAGFFVVLSVTLGLLVNPHWLWFTAFVGLNMLQSAFTNWCPMVSLLRALGLRPCEAASRPVGSPIAS